MIARKKPTVKTATEVQQSNAGLDHLQQAHFLQEIIEGLQDGILILTETGELIHANTNAYRIVNQLNQNSPDSTSNFIPEPIWSLCKSLVESRNLFPDKLIILSDEVVLDRSAIFRIRAMWMKLEDFEQSCFLVTIENRYESLKSIALAEVKKYNMTRREAEIWFLYRANYSYKEIAHQLYISLNTVKKHMKNIHAKRQAFLNPL